MKNEYIKISINKHNEFKIKAYINIDSIDAPSKSVNVKIDTGCPNTVIPVKILGISDSKAVNYKNNDCNSDLIQKFISFGVNDSIEKIKRDVQLFKDKKYMELNSVTFLHKDVAISINDIQLPITNGVRISYDRIGNILIGMDILKNLDIHIGTIETGETIFLACPKDKINDAYLLELNRLFHIGTDINASEFREYLNQNVSEIEES